MLFLLLFVVAGVVVVAAASRPAWTVVAAPSRPQIILEVEPVDKKKGGINVTFGDEGVFRPLPAPEVLGRKDWRFGACMLEWAEYGAKKAELRGADAAAAIDQIKDFLVNILKTIFPLLGAVVDYLGEGGCFRAKIGLTARTAPEGWPTPGRLWTVAADKGVIGGGLASIAPSPPAGTVWVATAERYGHGGKFRRDATLFVVDKEQRQLIELLPDGDLREGVRAGELDLMDLKDVAYDKKVTIWLATEKNAMDDW